MKRFKIRISNNSKLKFVINPITDLTIVVLHIHRISLVLYLPEYKSPKALFYTYKYRLCRRVHRLERKLEHALRMRFDKRPVYCSVTSMDCDLVESTSAVKHDSYADYQNWMNDDSVWDWVEGRTSVDIIDALEYDELCYNPPRNRDYIMEAYENGNGTSVVI